LFHTTNQLPGKYIYILEWHPKVKVNSAVHARPLQTLFKEEDMDAVDPEHLMVWIQYPTGSRELLNKTDARERWQRLVNQGWTRADDEDVSIRRASEKRN